jgi:hypothetical protein
MKVPTRQQENTRKFRAWNHLRLFQMVRLISVRGCASPVADGRTTHESRRQKRGIHSALIICELSDPRAADQVTVASAFAEPE